MFRIFKKEKEQKKKKKWKTKRKPKNREKKKEKTMRKKKNLATAALTGRPNVAPTWANVFAVINLYATCVFFDKTGPLEKLNSNLTPLRNYSQIWPLGRRQVTWSRTWSCWRRRQPAPTASGAAASRIGADEPGAEQVDILTVDP
jgi:hypothetical protein